MLRFLTFVLALLASDPCARAAGGYGIGAFPLSPTTVSMWLLDGQSRPALLVYFTGPKDWHHHGWKSTSEGNGKKDAPVTYRLTSPSATLELGLSADRHSVLVQGHPFSAATDNVFVVRHANDPQTQVVEPLGRLELPANTAEPLPVAVLRQHPDLNARLTPTP